jgi:hypothetical protein
VPGVSDEARVDTMVGTKDPQLVQIEHTPGEAGRCLVERILSPRASPGGLYLPNRGSSVCGRRYCPFAEACEREFGGTVAA